MEIANKNTRKSLPPFVIDILDITTFWVFFLSTFYEIVGVTCTLDYPAYALPYHFADHILG